MENQVLLDIAKKSIEKKFDTNVKINKEKLLTDFPELSKNGATFITLTLDNQLRGCIGTLQAYRPLFDDLISNSNAAAFEDPRFYELTSDEFKKVKIEISILSTPVEVIYADIEDLKSKINIGVDGIILKQGENQATFLPQVWEDIKDFDTFFIHLCKKARLDGNCLASHPQIYKYQAEKIK